MDNSEMMKAELAKGPTPKRKPLAVVGASLAVLVLTAGGIVGVKAANDYRADIDAKTTAAQEYYAAAAEQQKLAVQAADDAAQSAQDAQDAVDAATAAEAAAEAQAAAEAAAQAAADQSSGGASKGARGDAVPFIRSTDPNNANGGDYIDPSVYCQSGSASTVGGVPVCD